jgi:cytochrome c biogenesis protein CcmG/thiol:disulfide interchange protein DsbE
MTHKIKRRRKQNNNAQWFVLGIGVLMVIAAVAMIWSGLRGTATSASAPESDTASVIPMAVNYPAPQLALQNINGTNETLADFHNNILLVNNWATWCPPCKAEMPTLEAYYEAHAAQGFMIVAIEAGDALEGVSQFAQSRALKFHVWLDPRNASLAAFRNENLPNSYVIDRSGTVRYAWTGAISRNILEKYITPLLGQSH